MRDIEFIYRRLFESCGTCKRSQELRDLHKEMLKFRIEPDKVTIPRERITKLFYNVKEEVEKRRAITRRKSLTLTIVWKTTRKG